MGALDRIGGAPKAADGRPMARDACQLIVARGGDLLFGVRFASNRLPGVSRQL